MVWLPDGEKISNISLFVLALLTNVTDGRTDRHRVTAIAALCIASHGNKTILPTEYKVVGHLIWCRFDLGLRVLQLELVMG